MYLVKKPIGIFPCFIINTASGSVPLKNISVLLRKLKKSYSYLIIIEKTMFTKGKGVSIIFT